MKKKLAVSLAALTLLCACTSPTVESAPPETVSPAPSPSVSPGPVYTDWSKLEDYAPPENIYTRYYEQPTDSLIPVEGGYGAPLVPFAGAEVEIEWGWPEYLYGLTTPDGVVVCDPVYSYIYEPAYYDAAKERSVYLSDYLVLSYARYEPGDEEGTALLTLAASDGSWVLEGDYTMASPLLDGRMLLMDEALAFWLCDSTGTLTPSPLTTKPPEVWGEWWREMGGFRDGVACLPYASSPEGHATETSGYWLLNALTGQSKHLPDVDFYYGWNGSEPAGAQGGEEALYGFLDRQGDWIIPPQFSSVDPFIGDFAQVTLTTGESAVIDRAVAVVLRPQGILQYKLTSDETLYYYDFVHVTESKDEHYEQYQVVMVYDGALQPLPDHPAIGQYTDNPYGPPAFSTENGWIICDGETVYELDYDGEVFSYSNGLATLTAGDGSQGLYDCAAQEWIIPTGEYDYIYFNDNALLRCYWATPLSGKSYYDLMDADGQLLTRVSNGPVPTLLMNRPLIQVTDELGTTLLDAQGQPVFRWLFPLGAD